MSPPPVRYPILIVGESRRALVVGAGPVGQRKAMALRDGGFQVTMLAPGWRSSDGGWSAGIEGVDGVWPDKFDDLSIFDLIIAATNDRAVNQQITHAAKGAGVLVNVADSPADCDFFTMGTIRRGDVVVALGTGGTDPRKARRLREALEAWLEENPELL